MPPGATLAFGLLPDADRRLAEPDGDFVAGEAEVMDGVLAELVGVGVVAAICVVWSCGRNAMAAAATATITTAPRLLVTARRC
ncbi:MAG: hypothetical protein QOJ62_1677 [Actinomycetota bacterium]|nr:hypothetical protein [Actinomycetota bacterium]